MVTLCDNLTMDASARICADGCLVAEVRAARIGIQDYLGREVDPEGTRFKADQIVRVFRPESEVFKTDSMASFAAAPFTIDHPSEPVTADNWKRLGVGEVNGDVVRDGSFVRVPVIVRDASAVGKVNTTHKQLSMGYACNLDFTPGTFDGQAYDAIQRDIRINHIAAVRAARGGSELKITDERAQEPPIMKKILIDGLQVDLSDSSAVEVAITKLQGKVADGEKALTDQKAEHDRALAAKDAEIDGLKAKVVDEATIDRRAAEKADVIAKAAKIVDGLETDGKSVAEIRRMAVAKKLGDAVVADKSDDYVSARFDGLLDAAPVNDNLRKVISSGTPAVVSDTAAIRNAARASRYA